MASGPLPGGGAGRTPFHRCVMGEGRTSEVAQSVSMVSWTRSIQASFSSREALAGVLILRPS